MNSWLVYLSDAWLEALRAAAAWCHLWSLELACITEQWQRREHSFEDDTDVPGWPVPPVEGVQ
jgi:hypothetical protein